MKNIYVFGPRYDEAEWNEHSQNENLVKALCELCCETIMLIVEASELAKNTHTICRDCARTAFENQQSIFITYADYEEIQRLLNQRKKAKLN